jgi:hypothetical protein
MSSWVVNALWSDTAFRLSTFLCVCNSEVHVEKKSSLKITRKPELHYSVQKAKQLKLTTKKLPAMSLCLKKPVAQSGGL